MEQTQFNSEGPAPFFSREMSRMIKGIAILMMLMHHCFAFPAFWLDGFQTGNVLSTISDNFKICVAMYAFITGYGFCAGKVGNYRKQTGKVLTFLGQYWLQLFLIFLPIASVSYTFSLRKILYNMAALHDNVVLFAWYVFFHCIVMLTFPLVRRLLNGGLCRDLVTVLFGGYCVTVLFYFQPLEGPLFSMLIDCSVYYPVVGMGYLTAKYALFDRIAPRLNIVGAVFLIPLAILLRTKLSVVKGFTFDTFYAPILIMSLCRVLEKCGWVHKPLMFLGKYSFHMWLFHSIFFSAYTRDIAQPLINWTSVPILRFVLVTILSAAAAVLIDRLWNISVILTKRLGSRIRSR